MFVHIKVAPHFTMPGTKLCTHLQKDHVGFVLLPDAQVIHEELQHVEGLFFAHVQQQHSGHKADTLTVADLGGAKRKECASVTTFPTP